MRLFTHNMLQCNVNSKKCPTGLKYPLALQVDQWEPLQVEYNQEFLEKTVLHRLNWDVLTATCKTLGWPQLNPIDHDNENMPSENKDGDSKEIENELAPESEAWWKRLHEVLLERRIVSGHMTCNGCGHVFPIKESIPNMLISNEEA